MINVFMVLVLVVSIGLVARAQVVREERNRPAKSAAKSMPGRPLWAVRAIGLTLTYLTYCSPAAFTSPPLAVGLGYFWAEWLLLVPVDGDVDRLR